MPLRNTRYKTDFEIDLSNSNEVFYIKIFRNSMQCLLYFNHNCPCATERKPHWPSLSCSCSYNKSFLFLFLTESLSHEFKERGNQSHHWIWHNIVWIWMPEIKIPKQLWVCPRWSLDFFFFLFFFIFYFTS